MDEIPECQLNQKKLEEDRKWYDRINLEQSMLLDKSIISVSTAAFGIALAFTKEIIDLKLSVCNYFFIYSLLLLGISIMVTILSFFFSEKASAFYRNRVDVAEREGKAAILDEKLIWEQLLHYTNLTRLLTFLSGMSLLISFIAINGFRQLTAM